MTNMKMTVIVQQVGNVTHMSQKKIIGTGWKIKKVI